MLFGSTCPEEKRKERDAGTQVNMQLLFIEQLAYTCLHFSFTLSTAAVLLPCSLLSWSHRQSSGLSVQEGQ